RRDERSERFCFSRKAEARIGPCPTRLSGIHSTSGSASFSHGFNVSGVERAVKRPHDLHVLLRHRLCSISRWPTPGPRGRRGSRKVRAFIGLTQPLGYARPKHPSLTWPKAGVSSIRK